MRSPCSTALRAHGLRIGLISNGQRDLEEFARHHELDVDVAVGSKSHGRTKPHASIFETALAALGVAAAETVMVGDSYADDIEGARALGMRAILLDREGLYPDEPDRITDLLQLPAALGLTAADRQLGLSVYPEPALTDRSIARERPARDRQAASEEKRRLILDAAVRVFARDGYHTSRVGDIAEEAGIAHGLLYHYFSSKEEVLATLFRENWGELLGRLDTRRAVGRAGRRAAARDRQDPAPHVAERPRPRARDGARGGPQLAPAGAGGRDPGRGSRRSSA